MNIVTVKSNDDPRLAIVPDSIKKLSRLEGVDVLVEKGLSEFFSDKDFSDVGATLLSREEVLEQADILLGVNKFDGSDLSMLRPGTLVISPMDVYQDKDYIKILKTNTLSAISLEMIPRTTLAQKMDIVSSQASIAGYVSVIAGSEKMKKMMPMMMTPAGTIKPAKVFVIGAGVAGLQAIATAKRLGAKVTAFDTRPAVKEQVESLGAKFLEIDLGSTGETEGGYAKELTKEQLQKQQDEMKKVIQESDLVITTAKLFGRKAPIIIKKDVVKGMKQGSVIVDLAASTGGNVEGTVMDKVVTTHGVTIIGDKALEVRASLDASMMFSSNMVNLISHFWDKEEKTFSYKEDEILEGCLVTKDGVLVHKKVKEFYGG